MDRPAPLPITWQGMVAERVCYVTGISARNSPTEVGIHLEHGGAPDIGQIRHVRARLNPTGLKIARGGSSAGIGAALQDTLTLDLIAPFVAWEAQNSHRASDLALLDLTHTALSLTGPAREVAITLLLGGFDGPSSELERAALAATT